MNYDVNILNVGDADAIVINYEHGEGVYTAVIDAGNVGDGYKLKQYIKHKYGSKFIIDYAVCTHPDKDHKGGFFDLYDDNDVIITNFVTYDPVAFVRNNPNLPFISAYKLVKHAGEIYNHPNDPNKNLLDIAREKSNFICDFGPGDKIGNLPLWIVGPSHKFYSDAALEMAGVFAELKDETGGELYSEDEIPSEEDAKGVLDTVKEDSPTNKASLILLFKPSPNCKYLLTGDACAKSIHDAYDLFPNDLSGCVLKVPHHGSKHNLTTEIIDLLQPVSAVISCKGSKKHPSSSVVYWLSKYCDVFATSKTQGTLTYQSAPNTHSATPLKKKIGR